MYSWKLEKSDKLPARKKDCIALRIQIESVQKKLEDAREEMKKMKIV